MNNSSAYIELLTTFPPRPINAEEELMATQEAIDSLLDKGELTRDERDYLHVLGMLVYEYEQTLELIPDIYGVELLKALIENFELRQKDLVPIFKTESIVTNSIENFPCDDLRTIDQLWVKYSQGRFGFSVQKKIWLEVGGKVDYDTECKLGDRVGWRKEGKWVNYDYDDLTFNQKPAPVGHLPGNGFWRAWLWFDFNLISSSLASKAVSCNL